MLLARGFLSQGRFSEQLEDTVMTTVGGTLTLLST